MLLFGCSICQHEEMESFSIRFEGVESVFGRPEPCCGIPTPPSPQGNDISVDSADLSVPFADVPMPTRHLSAGPQPDAHVLSERSPSDVSNPEVVIEENLQAALQVDSVRVVQVEAELLPRESKSSTHPRPSPRTSESRERKKAQREQQQLQQQQENQRLQQQVQLLQLQVQQLQQQQERPRFQMPLDSETQAQQVEIKSARGPGPSSSPATSARSHTPKEQALPPHVHLRPAVSFSVKPVFEGLHTDETELTTEAFRSPEGGALKIVRVGAAIEKWNAMHKNREVRPGDYIVDVGGKTGTAAELRAAIAKAASTPGEPVEFFIKRVVGQAAAPADAQCKPPSRTLLQRLSARGGGCALKQAGLKSMSMSSASSSATTAASNSGASFATSHASVPATSALSRVLTPRR